MATAEWTYEVPAFGSDAVWLEEYAVYDREGQHLGTVLDVLEHEGRLWLAVERSHLPLHHHRHAIPFDDIGDIDHDAAAIHLKVSADDVEESTPELDPSKAVEEGEAEASRVTDPPREMIPFSAPPAPAALGPADPPEGYVVWPFLTRIAGVSLLAVCAYYTWRPTAPNIALFAIPAFFIGLALASWWRAWRRPWVPPPRRR